MRVAFSDYLAELGSVPAGPGSAACFDLDRTLIDGYSVKALAWEGIKSRTVPLTRVAYQFVVFCGYSLGRLDYQRLMGATLKDLADLREADFMRLGERAFERRVAAKIFEEARTLVAAHRRLRHRLILVTSATRAQAAPVAATLSIPDLRCTELEVADGCLTGAFKPCYGDEKRRAVLDWLAEQGVDASRTYFYSDSDDDLPLLEAVGKPVAVNAKPRLAEVAAERRWPELAFVETGSPTGPPPKLEAA